MVKSYVISIEIVVMVEKMAGISLHAINATIILNARKHQTLQTPGMSLSALNEKQAEAVTSDETAARANQIAEANSFLQLRFF